MTEEKQEGPTVQVEYYCSGCKFHEAEYFTSGDDDGFWGHNHFCSHPSQLNYTDYHKFRGLGYSDRTPKWCPFLPQTQQND
jgi:hypothetical protein